MAGQSQSVFSSKETRALTGVAQWVECHPGKVIGSIPGQGARLGCGLCLWLGVCERQPIDVPLPLSPSLSLSLKINK